MRVNGTTNIWDIDDVGSSGPKQITDTGSMIKHLAVAVEAFLLKNSEVKEYKSAGPMGFLLQWDVSTRQLFELKVWDIWLRVKKGKSYSWIMRRDMWMETS